MSTIDTALIYLLFAVVGVVGCRLLHLPAILGYLLAGIFLGQGGALIEQSEAAVASVAELGVVLLMFVIGLEFNLPKLLRLRQMVFGFGMAQVLVTLLGTVFGHFLLSRLLPSLGLPWDLTWQGAVVLGAALAMSSTAIVVKLMAERSEMDTGHGRRVIGRGKQLCGSHQQNTQKQNQPNRSYFHHVFSVAHRTTMKFMEKKQNAQNVQSLLIDRICNNQQVKDESKFRVKSLRFSNFCRIKADQFFTVAM